MYLTRFGESQQVQFVGIIFVREGVCVRQISVMSAVSSSIGPSGPS